MVPYIGNDIVDFSAPGAVGKHHDERFVARVFTGNERQWIEDDSNPDRMLWTLWSCKETAYKAVGKSHRRTAWAPVRYTVHIEEMISRRSIRGVVGTPAGNVLFEAGIEGNFVHCIGTSGTLCDLQSIVTGVNRCSRNREVPPDLSKEARALIVERLASHGAGGKGSIKILRPGGARGLNPPIVSIGGRIAPIDISLSHDGLYVACAFIMHRH